MEKSLNEGRLSEKGQDKVYVVILHFPSKKLWTKPPTSSQGTSGFLQRFSFSHD